MKVRILWQLAHTKSHLEISANTRSLLRQRDTLIIFSLGSRWSKSITPGGNDPPQSSQGWFLSSSIHSRCAAYNRLLYSDFLSGFAARYSLTLASIFSLFPGFARYFLLSSEAQILHFRHFLSGPYQRMLSGVYSCPWTQCVRAAFEFIHTDYNNIHQQTG